MFAFSGNGSYTLESVSNGFYSVIEIYCRDYECEAYDAIGPSCPVGPKPFDKESCIVGCEEPLPVEQGGKQ